MTRRYPAYREPGVEWLGEVPAGWDVARIKDNTYLKGRVGWKGLTSEEFEIESFAYLVTGTDFKDKFIDWSTCYQVDEFRYSDDPFIQLKDGDLLITKDGTIGKLAIVEGLDRPACLNSGIFLVRPKHSYETRFLYWVLSSNSFSVFCDLKTYGSTINHLYQNVFENFSFPVPTIPEQTAIAAFLDRETAKIDALVAEQRRLIDLLREKRQAVISHAVTRGLNPTAKLKPSGIDWLGDVPEGWEVVPVGYRYEVQLGQMLNEERSTGNELRPYLRVADVQWQKINTEALPEMNFPEYARERYRLAAGDLLVTEGGYIGRSAIWRGELEECYYQKALHRLRPRTIGDTTEFFVFVMEMAVGKSIFVVGANQTTIQHLTAEQLRGYRFAFPQLEEQLEIARFLKTATTELDDLTATAETAITLLQERRAALISAAVTGKIDVRDHVAAQTEAA